MGQPAFAELGVLLDPDPDASDNPYGIPQFQTLIGAARRGKHHLTAKINYPSTPQERTLKVGVAMVTSAFTGIIARQQIDQVIDWPDYQTWQLDEFLAKASPEQSLQRAAELIDSDVVSEDIAGVLTMRQLGVDYSRIRYRGATAFDVASRLGDSALLTALGSKGVGL